MENIATVQSKTQAQNILQNMITAGGGWISKRSNQHGPIYERLVSAEVGATLEELFVEKEAERRWHVKKSVTPQPNQPVLV